jgi:replication factor C subunit 3/5
MGCLYIDKYSPLNIDDVYFNIDIKDKLKEIANHNDISHMIISGSKCSGKKTLANLFIDYKYRNNKVIRKTKIITLSCKNNVKKEIKIIYSNYHIQIDPSLYGVYDRIVIKDYINDIVKNNLISGNYITFIIENADKLSIDAQESLRRSLEKNIETCRFIFLVDQSSTMIEPLNSRCAKFRLSAPNEIEIKNIMKYICQKENIPYDENMCNKIIKHTDYNIKESINNLQLFHVNGVLNNYIDDYLIQIVNIINKGFKPDDIRKLRILIHDLIVHCTDPLYIVKYIFNNIILNIKPSNELYEKLLEGLIKCTENLKDCNKIIYHIEAFILYIAINI